MLSPSYRDAWPTFDLKKGSHLMDVCETKEDLKPPFSAQNMVSTARNKHVVFFRKCTKYVTEFRVISEKKKTNKQKTLRTLLSFGVFG